MFFVHLSVWIFLSLAQEDDVLVLNPTLPKLWLLSFFLVEETAVSEHNTTDLFESLKQSEMWSVIQVSGLECDFITQQP